MRKPSQRVSHLKQSGIRAASQRCEQIDGINLGQGICDLPVEPLIKEAAFSAIKQDKSKYSSSGGISVLKERIAQKIKAFNKIDINPASELVVSHGSTGAYMCAVQSCFNPGENVILFEPFYGYHKHLLEILGVNVKTIPIKLPDLTVDLDELAQTIDEKTAGIVICTPCNPSGKVFSKEELLTIGRLAEKHNLWIITDEIYEYITYPGHEHISIARLENFKERTLTISGFSKTYNMTGWRLGYVSGPAQILERISLVQDLFYVCPATPLQHAVIDAFDLSNDYYDQMCANYLKKRDFVVNALQSMQFEVTVPQGAYYILADFRPLGFKDDHEAMEFMLQNAKVASVTGRSFYDKPESGQHLLRFCYALSEDKLNHAMENMQRELI